MRRTGESTYLPKTGKASSSFMLSLGCCGALPPRPALLVGFPPRFPPRPRAPAFPPRPLALRFSNRGGLLASLKRCSISKVAFEDFSLTLRGLLSFCCFHFIGDVLETGLFFFSGKGRTQEYLSSAEVLLGLLEDDSILPLLGLRNALIGLAGRSLIQNHFL
jgi:hypothetical protein